MMDRYCLIRARPEVLGFRRNICLWGWFGLQKFFFFCLFVLFDLEVLLFFYLFSVICAFSNCLR